MNILVTGGAGLVGSTLCPLLLSKGAKVFCVDNLTLGTERHLQDCLKNENFTFENWDVSQPGWHEKLKGKTFDLIVHLAANSDISLGHRQPEMDYQRTLATTFETLNAARSLKVPNFIFSSTSAVYGEDPVLPTPEETTKIYPVSIYGAGKLASEAYISAFVENYKMAAWVYRFGNVVGTKLTHGVIYDFVKKLKKNPEELQVLGNGHQIKTYIHVEDCTSGILHGFEKSPAGNHHKDRFQIFNLSTEGQTSVRQIAEETNQVVTQGKAKIKYGSESIGWVGDVPKTSLDVSRMAKLQWTPKLGSTEAVFSSIRGFVKWDFQQ